jgi:hypothetical protein
MILRSSNVSKLTLMTMRCSMGTGMVGDERTVGFSDEHQRKGITKIRRLRKNESDSFGVNAYLSKAELQGHS